MAFVGLFGIAACTGARPELLVGETIPPPTTLPALETLPPTTAPLVPEAKVVISPTGVVLPVREVTDAGYIVTTPCSQEGFLVWGTPISEARVVLDPGHGGGESGAVGPNGLAEKDINLSVAKRTASLLTSRGISNVLTRTADYRIRFGSDLRLPTGFNRT